MKDYVIKVLIRFMILYAIILAISFFGGIKIEYTAFVLGVIVAFFTLNSNGISNYYDATASLSYGSDMTPVKKKIFEISPTFIASMLVFISSFLVYMF